jgi:drebrin-like protein
MNLAEGEIIEQIEEIDEGWWSGIGSGGTKTGLFPGIFFHLSRSNMFSNTFQYS